MALGISKMIKPSRPALVASALLAAISAVLAIVPYIAITEIAQLLLSHGVQRSMWIWAIVGAISVALSASLYSLAIAISHFAEAKLRTLLRQQLTRVLGCAPLGRIEALGTGSIHSAVCENTSAVHTLVAHVAGDATNAAVMLITGIVYLFWVNWALALAVLILWLIVIGIALIPQFSGYAVLSKQYMDAQAELSKSTVELAEGIKEAKSLTSSSAAYDRFDKANNDFSGLNYKWLRSSGVSTSIVLAYMNPGVVFASLVPLCAWFVYMGWASPAYVLPFLTIGIGLPAGLMNLMSIMQHIYLAKQAAQNTAELLSTEPLPDGKTPTDVFNPSVKLDNVSFGYREDEPVIRNVSLNCPAGKVTALVGPSGSGKTTLARLIARFYDVTAGSVKVSGHDVREVSQEWLLSKLAIVFQDVSLSNDTIAENIALGCEGATQAQVEAAAKAAQIHDRIMQLPNGYQTVIGMEGGFLSGGERQRLTIARAFLRDCPILILDEATAQADPESEHAIHRALTQLCRGRTVIVIAHRLATISGVDQIGVLVDGELEALGTHDQLLADSPTYASMWRRQEGKTNVA